MAIFNLNYNYNSLDYHNIIYKADFTNKYTIFDGKKVRIYPPEYFSFGNWLNNDIFNKNHTEIETYFNANSTYNLNLKIKQIGIESDGLAYWGDSSNTIYNDIMQIQGNTRINNFSSYTNIKPYCFNNNEGNSSAGVNGAPHLLYFTGDTLKINMINDTIISHHTFPPDFALNNPIKTGNT